MSNWTYTREFDERGDWIVNRWIVRRDGETVGRIVYVSVGGDAAYNYRLIDYDLHGHAQTLPDALNAIRDALT